MKEVTRMPEETDSSQQAEQQQPEQFTPITSQEDLDKVLGKRLERERSKFADYDQLREKATKFDEVAEQSKTELQRAIERAEQAEQKASTFETAEKQRAIAAEFDIIPELVHGKTEDEMRATAKRAAEWRDSSTQQTPKPPARKLGSGSSGPEHTGEKGRAAAALRTMRQG